MATIPNTSESTFTDGSGPGGDVLNINTASGIVQIPNGKTLAFYSGNSGSGLTGQIKNGLYVSPTSGATGSALASSGTITTAPYIGVAKVLPTAAVTAIVLGTGTIDGQPVTVVNEAAPSFSVQMAASATSNVIDGVSCIIPGGQQRTFVWDAGLISGSGAWVEQSSLVDGKVNDVISATAPAIASSGTITTAGVGTTQVTPAAAVTSAVLAAGTYAGQEITVLNASTTGANSVAFAASATSNVANGASTVISGLTCARFKWSGALWFHSV